MKKIIQILVIGVFLFTSFLAPIQKAHANPYAMPLIKLAAGSAAGPYVIAGVLIAAGGAAVIGLSDEDVRRTAGEIWDRTSDGFKNTITDSIEAGSGVVNWTEEMSAELSSTIGSMTNSIGNVLHEWTASRDMKERKIDADGKLSVSSSRDNYYYNAVAGYRLAGGGVLGASGGRYLENLYYYGVPSVGSSYTISGTAWAYDSGGNRTDPKHMTYTGTVTESIKSAVNKVRSETTVSNMKAMFSAMGAAVSVIPLITNAPPQDVFNDNIDKALQGLQGVKEINIPLDNWLGKATTKTGEKVNVDTGTGAITYPDGRPYEGDITIPWDIPLGSGAGDIPAGTIGFPDGAIGYPDAGVANPSIPIDKVFPKPVETAPDVPAAPGLWGWLEGLLNAILDAIKALAGLIASAIGALFVPEKPIGEMFAPFIALIEQKFNSPSDFNFLKDAFSSGNNCPDDIKVNLLGGQHQIVDLGFACDAAKWWKPIMTGFIWFLFGFWLFRKSNQLMSKRGGVE